MAGFRMRSLSSWISERALHRAMPLRHPLPPMREYAIAPDFAWMLWETVRRDRPETIVETGSGVSTIVMAYALEETGRGHVYALEHDRHYAAQTRTELAKHGLSRWATVIDAPLEPIEIRGERHRWYSVRALDWIDTIDLVVDDGPPRCAGTMLRYASLFVFAPRLAPNATFLLDVIGREEPGILARWAKELPDFVQTRLDTTKGNVIITRAPAFVDERSARPDLAAPSMDS